MKYKEYGADKPDSIILLHGGGLSWWNYQEEAKLLQSEYHVILPVLDGHAGSDHPFTTIENNAEEIISFIDRKCGGRVMMIGGLSLGAQILLEILAKRGNICRYALVESAAVIPSKITNSLIGSAVSGSYGLIKNRSFAKLQFKSLHIKEELFEYYYRDTCRIEKSDMVAFLEANTSYTLKSSLANTSSKVYIFVGEKETREILHSAYEIHKMLPASRVNIMEEFYHGEFSLNHAEDYVRAIRTIARNA